MGILLSGLCLALALFLGSSPAAWADLTVCSAGCDVSNLIDSDRTWTAATYQVKEQIQVQRWVTFTLEPGVTLKFTAKVGLQVDGTLIARGNGDQRITFTSGQASPAPGDWGAILFTETAMGADFDGSGSYVNGSIFEHCVVEYAGGGSVSGAIGAQSLRAPFVYRSTLRNNGVSGIRFEGVQDARVCESTLSANGASNSVYGGGIYLLSAGTVTLSGNTLSGNSGNDGGGIYLLSSGTATLSGNRIWGNSASRSGGGIYLSSSGTVTLSDNPLISGNSAGSYGGGIYLSSSGTATLSNNILSANTISRDQPASGGGGIYLSSSGVTAVRENQILYHMAPSGGGGINVLGEVTLNRNDLLDNVPTQLWNRSPAGSPHLDARNNWWGTANEAVIPGGIWDWNDDPDLGVVDWRPYLTAPVFSNHPPSPPANPSPADGTNGVVRNPTLGWLASADPEPGDTVSYDLYLGTAAHPPLVSKGQSSPSYPPRPALLKRNTQYYWRVVARDSRGEETYGPRWRFQTGSSPSLLNPIGNKTVNEGQTLSFTLSGSDPDRLPLTFSASNLPPGASFDPIARRFSWTPTFAQAGTYAGVYFSSTNGTYTDSEEITITVVDVP